MGIIFRSKQDEILYYLYLILGGSVLSFGVFGNLIVIFYFGILKRCKKNYEFLILLLGIADFLTAVGHLLVDWQSSIPPIDKWKLGEITCKYMTDIFLAFNKSNRMLDSSRNVLHQIQKYCRSNRSSHYKEKHYFCVSLYIYVVFCTVDSTHFKQGL